MAQRKFSSSYICVLVRSRKECFDSCFWFLIQNMTHIYNSFKKVEFFLLKAIIHLKYVYVYWTKIRILLIIKDSHGFGFSIPIELVPYRTHSLCTELLRYCFVYTFPFFLLSGVQLGIYCLAWGFPCLTWKNGAKINI